MRTDAEGLRKCPTCGGKATPEAMGLRDYRWIGDSLPGRIGGMDIDFIVDQGKTGRMLALEFKPCGAALSTGARLTFKALRRKGIDVWLVWDCGDHLRWVELDSYGEVLDEPHEGTREDLSAEIGAWWNEA